MTSKLDEQLAKAAAHLSKSDPELAKIIKKAPPCSIKPHKDYYWELIDSIISQQLSVKAAATIERRFQELLGSEVPEPEAILSKSIEELRTVGLSFAKAGYIRDLAQNIVDGIVEFRDLDSKANSEIIKELTTVKGIGEWTAHMFLIFCMGRLDVLPTGDLGIRNGIKALYNLDHVATPQEIVELAEINHWHPYESVASWYIWHSLDNKPA